MKFRWSKKYLYWGITAFLVIVCSVAFFMVLYNLPDLWRLWQFVYGILFPFVLGGIFAYLLNPVMRFLETKCFAPLLSRLKRKPSPRVARYLAVAVAVLFGLAIVTSLVMMILPQLIDSITGIANNLHTYSDRLLQFTLGLTHGNPFLEEFVTGFFANLDSTLTGWVKESLLPQMTNIVTVITSGVADFLTGLKNVFLGIILAVYILASKEKLSGQFKKLLYAVLPVRGANTLLRMVRRSDKLFGGFILGKLIDSAIIGVLCFIGMSILGLPFPLLISVVVGVTNVIPFFGPFIGAIPSAILILMVDPLQSLYFLIFILLLQQFDGNILGPKILGDTIGLSPFWVMFAILAGGGLFGFTGMLFGVPAFALIYTVVVELCNARLARHELPVETETYYDLLYLDQDDRPVTSDEPVLLDEED